MSHFHKLVIAFLIIVLTGCSQFSQPAPNTDSAPMAAAATSQTLSAATSASSIPGELQVDPARLSKELHLYNWKGYIDLSLLNDFEKEYGVKVILDTYDSNEEMIAKLSKGNSGYDVVLPTDYAVAILREKNLLAKFDKSLLPNIIHVNPQYLKPYYDPENDYSVPYFIYTTGIAYRKDAFTSPPDSWGYLFDPEKLKNYPGKVTVIDDERETILAALLYLGKPIESTDPNDLSQVENLLAAQKTYLKEYDVLNTNTSEQLLNGDIVIAHAWNGTALDINWRVKQGISKGPEIGFVIPKEGGIIGQDNMVIPVDAPNQYTAHIFLNYFLRADVAAKNAESRGYITTNQDAERLLSPGLQALYKDFAPDSETMKRLQFMPVSVDTQRYHDLWEKIKNR